MIKLNISTKLPILIVFLCSVSIIGTGYILLKQGERFILDGEKNKLSALQSAREKSLVNYLSSIEQDLSSLSRNEYIMKSLKKFIYSWKILGENKSSILRKAYIANNAYPSGFKDKLDDAKDGSLYSRYHKRYHPWFRHFLKQKDYYDIFLIAANGDLVYSVFKELDYATNLITGEWKNTGLGEAFRAAIASKDKDKQFFFDFQPYAPSHGAAASFIAQAIMDQNNKLIGVLVFQMPIGRINSVMQVSAGLGKTGETYIVGMDNLMRNDSRFSLASTLLEKKITNKAVDLALAGKTGVKEVIGAKGENIIAAYGPFNFKGTRWALLAKIDRAEVMIPVHKMTNGALSTAIPLLFIIVSIALYFAQNISRPLSRMTISMRNIANGNFKTEIPDMHRFDEIGKMAASVQIFKENGLESKRLKEESIKKEKKSALQKENLLNELADTFSTQIGNTIHELSLVARELQDASKTMRKTSDQAMNTSSSVATASEETSGNMTTVSGATEVMAISAEEISKQVSSVAYKASSASDSADDTNAKVSDLKKLVDNIGEVVGAIREIAEQTNLLALNATIEAARAGNAGKGFAVVADEVKKLATETGKKTDEIESRISRIQASTEESVQAIEKIINNISEIDQAATTTASAVEEQSAVISEITRNVSEVTQATHDVAIIVKDVQKAANETGICSERVLDATSNVTQLSAHLKTSVSEFLSQIRKMA